MEKIKYGIIGAGQMAMGHKGSIGAIDEIEIVAVADVLQESINAFSNYSIAETEIAKKNGMWTHDIVAKLEKMPVRKDDRTQYFSDYNEILEIDEIDAVLVCTPDNKHVEHTEAVLAAGKHVISEKPAATSYEDLKRLENAVRKSDKIYQCGLECRYLPAFERARKLVEEKAVGNSRMVWCREFRGPFQHKRGNWVLRNDQTGGVFVEKTCHYFDLMTWFADSLPKKVIATAGLDVVTDIYDFKPDVFDNGFVIVEYENGARGQLSLCMFADNYPDIEIGIMGDRGHIELSFEKQQILMRERHTPTRTVINAKSPANISNLSHGGGVYLEHKAFIENIRKNKKPLTDIEVAKWSVLVGLAAEESARNGNKVVTF